MGKTGKKVGRTATIFIHISVFVLLSGGIV
jgi:hypothetical protein